MPDEFPAPSQTPDHPDDRAPAGRWLRAQRQVSRAFSRVGLTRDRRLLLWAAFTGMALAVIALAFIRPIQWLEHGAIEWARDNPSQVPVAVAIVPVLGALLCGAIQSIFKVKLRAHGVSSVLYAIHRKRAQIPPILAVRTWLGSTATISSGTGG